ncbi:MAG: ABC transporter permease [Candidatus Cyclobacteriaceae bacterium M3_2C_046]
MYQIIKRELKMFSQNTVMLAVFLGAPLFFGILLGYVYRDAQVANLPVLVVDFDNSPLSNQMIDALEDNQYLQVRKTLYDNHEVKSIMQQGLDNAVITIPAGFEGDIQQKRHPELTVDLNAANILTANYAARGIQHVLGTINAGIEIKAINKKGVPVSIAQQQYETFHVSMTRFFNPGANYLEFLWPGVLAAILQQVYLLALALTFSREFEKNTFRELTDQTKSTSLIMFSKTIPYFIIGMILWGGILKLLFPFFRITINMDLMAMFWITSLFILAATFIGIMVSILIPSQLKATEILMIVASPSFILSGFTWPLSQMPEWVQGIARTVPLTPFLIGFRKIFMLDGNLGTIQPELWNLIYITLASAIISWIALFFKVRKSLKLKNGLI